MDFVTIYEISKHTFFDGTIVIPGFVLLAFCYSIVWSEWKCRILIKVGIMGLCAIIIVGLVMLGAGAAGNVRNMYYLQQFQPTCIEGEISELEVGTVFHEGRFLLQGRNFGISTLFLMGDDMNFIDRTNSINRNGQYVRVSYTEEYGMHSMTVLKVEVAKEDIPPEKLKRLEGKYDNPKKLIE